jgi:hypothetical protein
MINRVKGQVYVFLAFVFCGLILGILSTVFFSAKIKDKVLNFLRDTIFGVLSGAFVLWCFWRFVCFEMRFFCFLGILTGAALYILLFKKSLDSVFGWLYNKIGILIKEVTQNAFKQQKNKIHNSGGGSADIRVGAGVYNSVVAKNTAKHKRAKIKRATRKAPTA